MSVILQLDKHTYNTVLSFSMMNGIDLSKFVLKPVNQEMTETEYLTKSKVNKKHLDNSIKEVKNGEVVSLEDLL